MASRCFIHELRVYLFYFMTEKYYVLRSPKENAYLPDSNVYIDNKCINSMDLVTVHINTLCVYVKNK